MSTRQCAAAMVEAGMKQADVTKQLSVSVRCIRIRLSRYHTGESLRSQTGRGRKPVLSRVAKIVLAEVALKRRQSVRKLKSKSASGWPLQNHEKLDDPAMATCVVFWRVAIRAASGAKPPKWPGLRLQQPWSLSHGDGKEPAQDHGLGDDELPRAVGASLNPSRPDCDGRQGDAIPISVMCQLFQWIFIWTRYVTVASQSSFLANHAAMFVGPWAWIGWNLVAPIRYPA